MQYNKKYAFQNFLDHFLDLFLPTFWLFFQIFGAFGAELSGAFGARTDWSVSSLDTPPPPPTPQSVGSRTDRGVPDPPPPYLASYMGGLYGGRAMWVHGNGIAREFATPSG